LNAARIFATASAGSGPFAAYCRFARTLSGFVVPMIALPTCGNDSVNRSAISGHACESAAA
jgi:hypothetical protein